MTKSKQLTTDDLYSSIDNISVPIGIIDCVRTSMQNLGLSSYLDSLKSKGISMSALTAMLISFGLSEDNSMEACSQWLKDKRVRKQFGIKEEVSQRTLNRTLQALGENREGIVVKLYQGITDLFPDLNKDTDMDGSAIAANSEGNLRKRGHPRDGNDGLQVEFMLGMFEESRIPFYIREFKGNASDEEQYARSAPEVLSLIDSGQLNRYQSISDRLVKGIRLRNQERNLRALGKAKGKRGRKPKPKEDNEQTEKSKSELLEMNRKLGNASWVIFDNGGASVYNTEAVNIMGHEYLTRKDMNKTDLELVKKKEPEQVEEGLVCWKEVFESSGRTKYIFRSDDLIETKHSAAVRKVERMMETAKALKNGEINPMSLVEKKNNEFIEFEVKVFVQNIVSEYTEEEKESMVKRLEGNYCGFFHLESSAELTSLEAIRKYRKRIAIEHAIKSMKNVACIKPLRVWDDKSITGRMVLALLAQAIVAIVRYRYPEDTVKVTRKGKTTMKSHKPDEKSIVRILGQLTATFYVDETKRNRVIYSGVTKEILGIFERMDAKSTRLRGLDKFLGNKNGNETHNCQLV